MSRALRGAALLCVAGAAPATADTWTNLAGSGEWNLGANWADGTAPAPGDAAVFPAPGPFSHVVTLAAPAGAQSLAFEDDYTINGSQLYITGAPISVAAGKIAAMLPPGLG